MCAKLRTATVSNSRDHASQSLLLLLARTTYTMVLFFMHIPFVVNHTINATPPERLQHHAVTTSTRPLIQQYRDKLKCRITVSSNCFFENLVKNLALNYNETYIILTAIHVDHVVVLQQFKKFYFVVESHQRVFISFHVSFNCYIQFPAP